MDAAYDVAGDVRRAVSLYEQAQAGQERLLGDDHPDTLASRNSIADYLREVGETRAAREVDENALAWLRRVPRAPPAVRCTADHHG